jgi:hypothetical protein
VTPVPGTTPDAPHTPSDPAAGPGAPAHTDLLLAWLACGDRTCPNCAYTLAGLRDPRCPECGAALALRVAPLEPRARSFLLGLIGLSCGLGFCAIFLLLIAVMVVLQPGRSMGPNGSLPPAAFCAAGIVATSVLLWWWWRARQSFGRLRPRSRAALAAACWIVSILVVALFAYTNVLR